MFTDHNFSQVASTSQIPSRLRELQTAKSQGEAHVLT
jgi:hypothetical protein